MKEIIFWFTNHQRMNYWLNYAVNFCKDLGLKITYNKIENWIKFFHLKISFKVNARDERDLIGNWDKNQYWVEDLFDNCFSEFFLTFIFDNKPFVNKLKEDINGEERN